MKVNVPVDYQDRRKIEYPKIEDQLDMIFHNGIDAWRDQISKIKAKYPKPDSEA